MQPNHNSKKLKTTILNSIGANSFGQVIGSLYQVLAVPLCINAWGISLYGEWLLLSTIPGYLAISDIGFVSAAANEMTILASKNEKQQALKVFQSIWAMILAISILILIVLVALTLLLPNLFTQSNLIDAQDLTIIIFCLSLYSLLAIQESIVTAGFRAGCFYGFSIWLGNLQRIIEVGSLLTALACQWSPLEISIIMLSVKGLSLTVYIFILCKKVTWIHFGFYLVSWLEIRRITHPALGFMAFPVANIIKNQGTITLIGLFLGASEVAIFSSVRTICNAGLQLLKIMQHSFWPEVSNAFAKQNIQLIQKINILICGSGFWLGLGTLFGLTIFGNTILIHWTLGKIHVPILFLLFMCMGNFAAGIWSGGSTILMAINNHFRFGAYYLLSVILMLVILMLLGGRLSLLGYAALIGATDIFLAMIVLGQVLPLIHQSFWVFTKDMINSPQYILKLILDYIHTSKFFRK